MSASTKVDLSGATALGALTGVAEAFSGAELELFELPDGRRVVIKRLPARGDWLTRATAGAGRVRRLWEGGVLARIRPLVDHTVLDIHEEEGHDVVVMRDATDDLLPPHVDVPREVAVGLLARLAALHAACTAESGEGLCPISARYAMFAPAHHSGQPGPGAHPLGERIVHGWELFEQHVDRNVVEAVFAIHQDPEPLERRLARFPATLLHGDAKLENLGLTGNGLVAIDWGELTGVGPREVDVGWFALKGSARIGCSPDALFADYEAASGQQMNPEALDLVCIGSLAQMGFRFALGAFASGPDEPDVAAHQLAWWSDRAAAALDRTGPI